MHCNEDELLTVMVMLWEGNILSLTKIVEEQLEANCTITSNKKVDEESLTEYTMKVEIKKGLEEEYGRYKWEE